MILKKGFIVAFEGIDGTGKTAQANMLYENLKKRGFDVILSKEPTDSIYGQKIKKLAQGERDFVTPLEEYRLFINDRKAHVENLIKPALQNNQIIILDRYYFSSIAYQGALGIDPQKIRSENEKFAPLPEVVFLLKVPPSVGLRRIQKGRNEEPNLFEKEENLKDVEKIFDTLKEDYIVPINGIDDILSIHNKILNVINEIVAHYLHIF
jgi:dTMP kinase